MSHVSLPPSSGSSAPVAWWRELTRYHWWILLVCSLGWLFDTMDQRLFTMARGEAMKQLIGKSIDDLSDDEIAQRLAEREQLVPEGSTPAFRRNALLNAEADEMGRLATTIFIIGWATGGVIFGILGDRWGRAKTMLLTILVYALFTALSGFSVSPYDFMFYRFLTGLGVGGEFSAGVALLAEVIPERPRPYALGMMQGLSAVGNMIGSVIAFFVLSISWRYLFFFGALPALLVVAVRRRLKEPESWVAAKAAADAGTGRRMGSYRDLFSHPRWRKNALIGGTIAVVGVTGVWGMGFYSPELIGRALEGLEPDAIARRKSVITFCQDIGAFFSMYGFAVVSSRIGRKPTFYLACLAGMISIIVVFGFLNSPSWLVIIPMGMLLGFGTLALFGGYAVYFPEIFPTRLRSTGVSFCYNVGRYLASAINLIPVFIFRRYAQNMEPLAAYRWTAITMASLYLVGIVVMYFAEETKDRALPTDEDEEPQPIAEKQPELAGV